MRENTFWLVGFQQLLRVGTFEGKSFEMFLQAGADRVRAAVEEFERFVLRELAEQVVLAHHQPEMGSIVRRNPGIRRNHWADKWRNRHRQ